ncbi:MAG: ATP synthase F1 subunit delta [Deltaproteobacteria bacterium]|nr:ATP synthase F1 subunit delta [Deltaproteobacteria bacterium]
MKSASVRVARRYARAVAQLCEAGNDGALVRATLDAVVAAMQGVPDALPYLANPTVPIADRRQVVTSVLDACNAQGTARNLVLLLLDKGRIAALPTVHREFNALLDLKTGRVEGSVAAAAALGEPALARLQALLGRMVGKQVLLTSSVDPDLIGGLVVRIGNTVYDASVANQLARLRQTLTAA